MSKRAAAPAPGKNPARRKRLRRKAKQGRRHGKATFLQSLLALADQPPVPDPGRIERIAARVAWHYDVAELLELTQKRADKAWRRLIKSLPDDLTPEEEEAIEPPPEQAELDEVLAAIKVMRDDEWWPKELYWGGI